MKTPKEVLKALANLRASQDFQVFIEFQRKKLATLDSEIREQLDEVILRRKQGQALEVAKLISSYEEAPKKLR